MSENEEHSIENKYTISSTPSLGVAKELQSIIPLCSTENIDKLKANNPSAAEMSKSPIIQTLKQNSNETRLALSADFKLSRVQLLYNETTSDNPYSADDKKQEDRYYVDRHLLGELSRLYDLITDTIKKIRIVDDEKPQKSKQLEQVIPESETSLTTTPVQEEEEPIIYKKGCPCANLLKLGYQQSSTEILCNDQETQYETNPERYLLEKKALQFPYKKTKRIIVKQNTASCECETHASSVEQLLRLGV